MTPLASDRLMFPDQQKFRLGVVEGLLELPGLLTMAICARSRTELTLMWITMTGDAVAPAQAKEGPIEVLALALETRGVVNQLRLVALSTSQIEMCSLHRVADLSVIERRLAIVTPPDQLEVATVMLHVTAFATLVRHGRMKAKALAQLLSKDFVAFKAKLARDSLLLAVTPQALVAAFEICVRSAQLPRGDLCPHQTSTQEPENGHYYRQEHSRPPVH